jgi:hypothetical protein
LLVSAGTGAPVYTSTSSIYINSARYSDNITAGTAGQLVYQSAANTTGFVGPGTSGQLLVSAGASAPVYTTTSTIQVGYSANILAGTAGQLVYQSAANTTGFVGPGTAGQFLQSAGAGAPTYVSTGTMYVQRAVQADSAAGASGSVANALTISTGLSGSPSTSYNGSAAITLTLNTATLMASSVAIAGGTTGQLVYQSAANTTGFVGPGTAGQFLQSAGAGAPTYVSTGTMYVQRAVQADSASGNAGSSSQVQTQAQSANANYYPVFVSANNASATAMSEYTTSSFSINPATSEVVLANHAIRSYLNSGSLYELTIRSSSNANGGYIKVLNDAAVGSTRGVRLGVNGNGTAPDAGTDVLTVADSGYIGIGTVSPASVLHVRNGTAFPQGKRGGASSAFFFENATVADLYLELANTATNYSGVLFSRAGAGNYGLINYNNATDNMVFYTAGTVQHTITSAGGFAFGASQTAYGSSGQVLQSNGNSPPSWVAPSSLAAASATQVTTQAQSASGTYYPVFVSANNASATAMSEYTTSTFSINPAAGILAIGGATIYSNAKLQLVNGDVSSGSSNLSQIAFQYNPSGGFTHYVQSRHDSLGTTDGNALVFNLNTGVTAGASSAFGTGNAQSYFMGYLTHRWSTSATERLRLTANGGVSFGASGTAYGSSGQILQSNGDAPPSWVAPSSLAAASATQVTTQAQPANANYYPVFVSANNASATAMSEYTTSSFYINPATGQHYISTPGSTALAINVNSGSDRYFLTCTGAVNSFSIYENGNTAYLNSYNNMSLRVNQNGGTGGNLLISGGNVMIGSGTPGAPLSFTDSLATKIQYNGNNSNGYTVGLASSVNTGDAMMKFVAGSTGAGEFGFYNTTNLRLLINKTGYVGVNTASPGAIFDVVGDGSNNTFRVSSASGVYRFRVDQFYNTFITTAAAADTIGLYNGGWGYFTSALSVGTSTTSTTGSIVATGEITAYFSDRRLKENVKIIDNAVTKVLSLNGITYTSNELAASFGYDQKTKLVGLFADEVEAVLPEATRLAPFDLGENGDSKSGENYKTIQYEKLVPLLVEAIKEQQQTINDQNSRIEKLEELVKNLAGKYSE